MYSFFLINVQLSALIPANRLYHTAREKEARFTDRLSLADVAPLGRHAVCLEHMQFNEGILIFT